MLVDDKKLNLLNFREGGARITALRWSPQSQENQWEGGEGVYTIYLIFKHIVWPEGCICATGGIISPSLSNDDDDQNQNCSELLDVDFGEPLHALVVYGPTNPVEDKLLKCHRLEQPSVAEDGAEEAAAAVDSSGVPVSEADDKNEENRRAIETTRMRIHEQQLETDRASADTAIRMAQERTDMFVNATQKFKL